MVDLHIHTSASDGSYSPWEVVQLAREAGLSAFSITDHDTVAGLQEILSVGVPSDIKMITGIEISSTPPEPYLSKGSFHILGYGIDPESSLLGEALGRLRRARETRNPKMISRLNDLGVSITMAEVEAMAGGSVVGRPHMAAVMVRKKQVDSVQEAFAGYLAHPVTVGLAPQELQGLLTTLAGQGLAGVEAYYSTHSPELTQFLLRCAESLGLLITGGSDFHGKYKAGIHLGVGQGDLHVPFDCYANLTAALL